jgi:nitrogen fixation protein NifZ
VSAYDIGDLVVAVKPLRQDGTYPDPDLALGDVLVPPRTVGEVLDVGEYLQEHVVYAVAFANGRLVGCLERELDPASVASTTTRTGDPIP